MGPLRWCLLPWRSGSTQTAADLCWQHSRGSTLLSRPPAWQSQYFPGWPSLGTGASWLISSNGGLLAPQLVRRCRRQPHFGQTRAWCLPGRNRGVQSAQEAQQQHPAGAWLQQQAVRVVMRWAVPPSPTKAACEAACCTLHLCLAPIGSDSVCCKLLMQHLTPPTSLFSCQGSGLADVIGMDSSHVAIVSVTDACGHATHRPLKSALHRGGSSVGGPEALLSQSTRRSFNLQWDDGDPGPADVNHVPGSTLGRRPSSALASSLLSNSSGSGTPRPLRSPKGRRASVLHFADDDDLPAAARSAASC